MKTKLLIKITTVICLFLLISCEKLDPKVPVGEKLGVKLPILNTTVISNITSNSANTGGIISSEGGGTITARGVCWSTSQNPTFDNNKTIDGAGTGNFTSNITGLMYGTTYYVRAYAINSAGGVGYGDEFNFTTNGLPILTTSAVNNIAETSAKSGGNIIGSGGLDIIARGVCWSTSQNPTTADNKTVDGTGTGSFTSNITELNLNTTYYVRAYATNSLGTAYGNQISFATYRKSIQYRLNQGETPIQIYNSGISLDSLYGKTHQGGLIFHLNTTTGTGLVAAPNDQSTGAIWGCYGTSINGADGTAIGMGAQNTIDIINGCSEAGIAARLCADLVLGGYNDWFLPSKDELQTMYNNLYINGYGSFDTYWYLSSSEYSNFGMWMQSFGYGYQGTNYKNSSFRVRAVRIF